MSEIAWSNDQKRIIDARDCEILVSAAAGSGKTAVLVERIFQRVIDEADPIDIDRFVVVTFTKAAAEHMKEKIRERLEDAIENPEFTAQQKERFYDQLKLLPSAHISTVHSFCSFVIGQYFHRIGIDPALRLGDDYELKMLRKDVLRSILEDEYNEAKDDFIRLVSLRTLIKNDTALEDWILSIYNAIITEPFPETVIKKWEDILDKPLSDESEFVRFAVRRESDMCIGIHNKIESDNTNNNKLSSSKYADAFGEIDFLCVTIPKIYEKVLTGETGYTQAYNDIMQKLHKANFNGVSKQAPKDEELCELWKEIRPIIDRFEKDKNEFFFQSLEESEKDRSEMAKTCHTILRLTKRFLEEFRQAKADAGIMDFSDLEQFALDILFDKDSETGKYTRSDAAIELSTQFDEIMIDEYQDSNRVQDTILWSVSDAIEDADHPWFSSANNRFMVGDIKQSIYRFRGACPELFEYKMNTFDKVNDTEHRLINLNENYRSRPSVLEHVNDVFELIMHGDIGGIEYNNDASLKPGGNSYEVQKKRDLMYADNVELDKCDVDFVITELRGDDRIYCEATHIARRIREMVEGDNPLFLEKGEKRRVKYSDIVILSRALKGIADIYAEAFKREGVPFDTILSQGFYSTREISLMTEVLAVIDNPRQDIPLAGVALSPIFDISEEMLANIRAKDKKCDLYESLLSSEDEPEIKRLIDMIDYFRELSSTASASELIEAVYEKTRIRDIFALLPDGDRRCANLDHLLSEAIKFDNAGHMGVHDFIRSFEKIKEIELDIGEVSTDSENGDVVRMMTIHKSKGLEFPVVILTRTATEAIQKEKNRFLTDYDLGIATYADDIEYGIKKKTIFRNIISEKQLIEEKAEAQRLLYVALTRAEEKLIITGTFDEKPKESEVDFYSRYEMNTYAKMILTAALDHPGFECREYAYDSVGRFAIYNDSTFVEENNIFDTSATYNENIVELLRRMEASGSDEGEMIPAKISVSEVKKAALEESDEGEQFVKAIEEDEVPVPEFVKQSEETTSASAYGTVWHQVMAYIDFSKTESEEEIRSAVDELIDRGRLKAEEKKLLRVDRLSTFFGSDLGQKMKKAYAEGRLHREQAFTMHKPASEIYPDITDDKPVLIQGIIDGYFETDDGIVLMDYKTDRVEPGEENKLIEHYTVQMKLYKEVLEMSLKKPVIRTVLYSFSLGKEVPI